MIAPHLIADIGVLLSVFGGTCALIWFAAALRGSGYTIGLSALLVIAAFAFGVAILVDVKGLI